MEMMLQVILREAVRSLTLAGGLEIMYDDFLQRRGDAVFIGCSSIPHQRLSASASKIASFECHSRLLSENQG
jgi:hypothetical protein